MAPLSLLHLVQNTHSSPTNHTVFVLTQEDQNFLVVLAAGYRVLLHAERVCFEITIADTTPKPIFVLKIRVTPDTYLLYYEPASFSEYMASFHYCNLQYETI